MEVWDCHSFSFDFSNAKIGTDQCVVVSISIPQGFPRKIRLKQVIRVLVVHAAVVIVDFRGNPRIVDFNQSLDASDVPLCRDSDNQAFINFCDVKMRGDCVLAERHVIEVSRGNPVFFDEINAEFFQWFTVIYVRQFQIMRDGVTTQRIYDVFA